MALRAEGPHSADDLARLVGGPYWKPGRFERALVLATSDGLLVRMSDGKYAVT